MVDFNRLKKIDKRNISITIELNFDGCISTVAEVEDRLRSYISNFNNKIFSSFIVDLLQITHSNFWELGECSVREIKE
jgi:hypothetical protein